MRLARRTKDIAVCICLDCDTSLGVPNDALTRFQQTHLRERARR
jgi:hypothetical protein